MINSLSQINLALIMTYFDHYFCICGLNSTSNTATVHQALINNTKLHLCKTLEYIHIPFPSK